MRHALLLLLASSTAWAESDAATLAAQGEELAKIGEYTRAIDAFKAADKLEQRSRHACMIGLAYLRREEWPRAELFLEQCKVRASIRDPLPDWFQDAMGQLEAKLDGTTVSSVTINVGPPSALALITVSSFAPDEKFAARTIHLAPGTHTIQVAAPGYVEQARTFTVSPSTPLTIDIELKEPEKIYRTPPASKVPWVIIIGGGALVAAGAVVHATSLAPLRNEIANEMDYNAWLTKGEQFKTRRLVVGGLYGLGAIAIGVGFVLRATVFERTPVLVGVEPTDGGGVVSVTW